MNDFQGKTVVITGASSGIGKAIALTLAQEGMNLVLAARREAVLQEVASECEAMGGVAIAVKTDVTNKNEVQNLKETAISFFGTIDIWINNAGTMAIGELNETPLEAHEQVIKTNLMAPLYGIYSILPYFKERKKGIIINTVSIGAYVPTPFAASYSAGKFGLRGLDEAVRSEVKEFSEIHLCDVNPAFINTPGNLHAANYTGKEIHMAPPVYDPFQVAHAVKKLIENPKENIMVGGAARIARFVHSLAPHLLGSAIARSARIYFQKAKSAPVTAGGLFSPTPLGVTARGENMKRPSLLKRILKPSPSAFH